MPAPVTAKRIDTVPLEVSYSPWLVAASLLAAVIASYSALRITSRLRHQTSDVRKLRICQASITLGLGIWSMYFLGMLAVELPITISYAPEPTLISALIAILAVGSAFLVLHFGRRSRVRIALAGILTASGIVAMHYVGMSAISENCLVTYHPVGVVVAVVIAVASAIFGFDLAYKSRTGLRLAFGAVVLGLAISAMHYTAMLATTFALGDAVVAVSGTLLDRTALAMAVTGSTFFLSGLFMLLAVPTDSIDPAAAGGPVPATQGPAMGSMRAERAADADVGAEVVGATPASPATSPEPAVEPEVPGNRAAGGQVAGAQVVGASRISALKIPFEINNATKFQSIEAIQAVRADGHYTRLICGEREFFCPWSISRMERTLQATPFIRTHRSYLVNRTHISGFKQDGDRAFCVIGTGAEVEIPVSRSRVGEIMKTLQLD